MTAFQNYFTSISFGYLRPFLCATATIICASLTSPCAAAEQNRSYLLEKFHDGDIPTGQDFADLIDSSLNFLDDRFHLEAIGVAPDGGAMYLGEGALVEVSIAYGLAGGLSLAWAGRTGFMPLTFTSDSELHYGYFQISSGQGGSGALYPMQFQYFVWEDQPNTPLMTSLVPEPSTLTLLAFSAIGVLAVAWRRKRAA